MQDNNRTISQLPSLTSISGDIEFPGVFEGRNYKVNLNQILQILYKYLPQPEPPEIPKVGEDILKIKYKVNEIDQNTLSAMQASSQTWDYVRNLELVTQGLALEVDRLKNKVEYLISKLPEGEETPCDETSPEEENPEP